MTGKMVPVQYNSNEEDEDFQHDILKLCRYLKHCEKFTEQFHSR